MVEAQQTSPYIVSALRHRPTRFREVLGQEHVTTTLLNSLERNRIANAYLFAGPRGTGKTSTARVLAKALNCEQREGAEPCNTCESCRTIAGGKSLDVLEIDAASNRGIEEIRDLRENVRFAPTYGQYRVVVIDEVHMLTQEANNALLKTLEEPPSHVKFVLATTEMHKIPATILSRCQRFRFRRIPVSILMDRLRALADQEPSVDLGSEAERDRILYHIARLSEGALRDAFVSLDQLLAFCSGKISLAEAEEILGVVEFEALENLVGSILASDPRGVLLIIERMCARGKEPAQFLKEILGYLRHLLVTKAASDRPELVEIPDEFRETLRDQAESTTIETILQVIEVFSEADRRMRYASEGRMILEVAAIKAAKIGESVELTTILEHLSALSGGTPVPKQKPTGKTQQPTTSKEVSHSSPEPAPPPPSETPPKTAQKQEAPKQTDTIAEAWKQLLDDPDLSAPALNSALEQSFPVSFEDGELVVAVPTKAGLARLKDGDYREMIAKKLGELLGKSVRVSYRTAKKNEIPSRITEERDAAPPDSGELVASAREHEIIQSLMEYIPGTVKTVYPEKAENEKVRPPRKEEIAT